MRLLRSADVEIGPNDRVFRYSRLHALFATAAVLALVAVLGFHARAPRSHFLYFLAGGVLLFYLLMLRMVTARFRPSNWLVRLNDVGFYIQFRSYLNYHLPAEDLTAVFLSFGEISSARLVKERIQVPDPQGRGTQTQFARYVELELAGDISALVNALDAEMGENAPMQKHWYGKSSTLYQDHPVRMPSPPFLRVRWQATPGPKTFLESLRPYTTIAETVRVKEDFSNLKSLTREQQEQRLRELAQRGQTIAAGYAAQRLYGCSLAEATTMVKDLQTRR